ncbi:MAG TPA: hypothetical protein VNR88_12650 [Hyphomicrobium sp.]|nr:hypothetical protein [Hyphomicrobium sp.]
MAKPELSLAAGGESVSVTLANGRRLLSAEMLWCVCPGARAKRRRIDGINTPPSGLAVTALTDVGYGVHVAFSADAFGGIFPWPMIIDLSLRPQLEDFIAPQCSVSGS